MNGRIAADEAIARCLEQIRQSGSVMRALWPDGPLTPELAGLLVEGHAIRAWPDTDWLDERRLQEAVGGRVSVQLVAGSTNSELMARAAADSVHLEALLAEFQSEGRGRRGRVWYSPVARNLALSFGFATKLPAFRLGGASLAVGIAVCDALRRLGGSQIELKWPNDLLVGGQKLCGILVEISPGPPIQLVVGIGINVELGKSDGNQLGQPATDLREIGVTADRSEIAAAVLKELIEVLNLFETEGFGPLLGKFDSYHAYQGLECVVIQGEKEIHGRVLGVGGDGHLRLMTDQGERAFSSGEVSLRRG